MSNATAVAPTFKDVRISLFSATISALNLVPRAVGVADKTLTIAELVADTGINLTSSAHMWSEEVKADADTNHAIRLIELSTKRTAAERAAIAEVTPAT